MTSYVFDYLQENPEKLWSLIDHSQLSTHPAWDMIQADIRKEFICQGNLAWSYML